MDIMIPMKHTTRVLIAKSGQLTQRQEPYTSFFNVLGNHFSVLRWYVSTTCDSDYTPGRVRSSVGRFFLPSFPF